MKLVVQRVAASAVRIEGAEFARIGRGLTVLFGAEKGDGEAQADFLAEKVANLRIFPDAEGKMNLSCLDVRGDILVVSQFTLAGDCSRGRRPGFERAAAPAEAERLYRHFAAKLAASGLTVRTGQFGAAMLVDIQNDGPVTFILERASAAP
jgi:D-tyrosyl-tRNA(Tyr) deacylase